MVYNPPPCVMCAPSRLFVSSPATGHASSCAGHRAPLNLGPGPWQSGALRFAPPCAPPIRSVGRSRKPGRARSLGKLPHSRAATAAPSARRRPPAPLPSGGAGRAPAARRAPPSAARPSAYQAGRVMNGRRIGRKGNVVRKALPRLRADARRPLTRQSTPARYKRRKRCKRRKRRKSRKRRRARPHLCHLHYPRVPRAQAPGPPATQNGGAPRAGARSPPPASPAGLQPFAITLLPILSDPTAPPPPRLR
ncbi:MAG: hypothetical protein J3K34DRAFT_3654 [Monoraphidium minutum]|nr:MAG: hypothetical protein J3K34DRAFT_3654 [Monoraphidium minutum]